MSKEIVHPYWRQTFDLLNEGTLPEMLRAAADAAEGFDKHSDQEAVLGRVFMLAGRASEIARTLILDASERATRTNLRIVN